MHFLEQEQLRATLPLRERCKIGCMDAAEQSEGYTVRSPCARRGIEDQDLWKSFISKKACFVKKRF